MISKQNAQVLSPLLHLLSLSHEESSSELVMSSAYRKATSGSSLSFNLEGLILMGYLELLAFKVSRYPFWVFLIGWLRRKKQLPDHKTGKVGNTGKITLWFDKKEKTNLLNDVHFFEILDQN